MWARMAVITGVTVLIGLVGGTAVADMHGTIDNEDVENLVLKYNSNVEDAPDLVKDRLAGNVVELRVGKGDSMPGDNSGVTYYFELSPDGTVVNYGESGNPDVQIVTTEEEIRSILRAPGVDEISREAYEREDVKTVVDSTLEAYDQGEIEIDGVGITKTTEVEVAEFGIWTAELYNVI